MPSSALVARRPGRFAWTIGMIWLWMFRWRVSGALPAVPKAVIIAAPHTSNWDLPHMLAAAFVLGIWPVWLGKRELFRWPFGGFMRWLGGLPVDRSRSTDIVQQAVDRFAALETLYLVVPPSGTRKRAPGWRSGFYHVARGADVPVVCSFLDYGRRVAGIGFVFTPSGDIPADMDRVRKFYDGVRGKYPELTTPVRLREEDAPVTAAGGA